MQFFSFFHATSQTNHYLELFTSNTLDSYDNHSGYALVVYHNCLVYYRVNTSR